MNIILYLETKMLKKIATNRASPVQAKWQKQWQVGELKKQTLTEVRLTRIQRELALSQAFQVIPDAITKERYYT